jgi:hypothetical protein
MPFYTRQYQRLRAASEELEAGLDPVYHVACFNFTLQYPLLLAPVNLSDEPTVIDDKIRTVAVFLDILLARRAVNYLSMTFAALSYAMFLVMRDIRGKSITDLAPLLRQKLDEQGCDFTGTSDRHRNGFEEFRLNQWPKRYIKVLLARMTAYIEQRSGMATSVATYLAEGRGRFEIEHIWADHYERHTDEFTSPADFYKYRDHIAGLLLLPKSFNASYGDLTYEDKLPHYNAQNLLARSLHPQCYDHNPGFLQFRARSGLRFAPHAQFKKADLDARAMLYRQIAECVWNPSDLLK